MIVDRLDLIRRSRRSTIMIALTIVCLVNGSASAQRSSLAMSPIGVWRGTSLCLVRPSPCRDESVVYRITRIKATDSLSVDARKMVNGQEEQMGVLGCGFEASAGRVTCTIPQGVWRFTIRGDSLVGELRHPDGTKYRDVRTAR